ncbi:MAG TPA: HEPN domain-containing protein [Bacteroidales bacterium]
MIESFEHKGKWKLIESETWFDGTLSFNTDNCAKLEIFGSFNLFLDRSSKRIVIGKTIAGDITLIDVWYRTSRSSYNGIVVEIYEPVFIIEGHHFNSESDILFRHVISDVFNLFQWFDLSGFDENFDYNTGNYNISYNRISPIPFTLNDQCQGQVKFDSPVSFNGFYNEKLLKEQAYFSLDYIEKTHYKTILRDLRHLTGFITLFTHEQSYPISITFIDDDYTDEIKNQGSPKYIKCIYQNYTYDSKYKLRRPHEHLVRYKDIQDKFPTIIKNWCDLYLNLSSVLNLMLVTFRNKNHFTDDKFMDTVKALESYHRITHNNQRIPEQVYEKLVSKILGSVTLGNADMEWLTNKLKGNEPSLNKRLKELLKENQNCFVIENIKDARKFCIDITYTRNYLTHHDKEGEKNALKGKDLFDATLNAQGLLYSCILKMLGLQNEHFEKGLKYHLYK